MTMKAHLHLHYKEDSHEVAGAHVWVRFDSYPFLAGTLKDLSR